MKLWFSPESLSDVITIKNYIKDDLGNPLAADAVVERVLHSCRLLKEMPYLGASLAERINQETETRYLISGKYLIFYNVVGQEVRIIRILDSRMNYMELIMDLL